MTQLPVPLPERLDAQLAEICNRTPDPSTLIPVLVRCRPEALAHLTQAVGPAGGTIRHRYDQIGGFAAWLPKEELGAFALLDGVEFVELEGVVVAASGASPMVSGS